VFTCCLFVCLCVCLFGCWLPAGEFCEERAERTELQNVCWNNCQGRGRCRRGFCHCKPGWWGKDCSSSKVYAPHAARRPVHKLRVYVYDLPWTVSCWAAVYGWQGGVPAVAPYGGGVSLQSVDWVFHC
jgi:hypothetical protein